MGERAGHGGVALNVLVLAALLCAAFLVLASCDVSAGVAGSASSAAADGSSSVSHGSSSSSATEQSYVEGQVLLMLNEETTTENLASLKASIDPSGAYVQELEIVSDNTVVLATLKEGVSVTDAVDALADAGCVASAQPNYIYDIAS